MASENARVISLEQAYDRTLASDQSIQIAYTEILKANLLPWSALTKFGPRITAGYSYNHVETTTQYITPTLGIVDARNANISLNQPLVDFTFSPRSSLANSRCGRTGSNTSSPYATCSSAWRKRITRF